MLGLDISAACLGGDTESVFSFPHRSRLELRGEGDLELLPNDESLASLDESSFRDGQGA